MSADLHIHILTNATEDDLALSKSNTMGSKYFSPKCCGDYTEADDAARDRIDATQNVWIGEVSWLKAALFEDGTEFIPNTVAAVSELVGENLPEITDEFIGKVAAAFDLPNDTGYSLAKKENVVKFLESHKGQKAFQISW